MRYILYARRSQEREERQVQSIEDQLSLTRQMARKLGLTVPEEITESKSAKEPDQRPGFSRMLRLVETGKADGILAWHPDRLSRNEIDAARITYLVRKGRLSLQFVNYAFDPSPEGIMMLQMALSQSQYYSSKLAKDVWRGMSSKIEKGWCPFRAPEGYRNDAETRTVIADPERFPLVRQAWDRVLTGAYSVPEVVRVLNGEWGYTTRPSKRASSSSRCRGGGPLSLPSAYKLFHNPYYTGHFVVNGVTYKGQHPAMVTAAEFNRVQELLARTGKRQPKKNDFAYTGLIDCARCDCRVTAEVQPGRFKPGRYVYYHCTNRKRICSKVGIREEALEAQIEGLLRAITIDSDVAGFALEAVGKWTKEQFGDGEAAAGQQEKALGEAEQQLNALLDLKLRGMVPDGLFGSKQSELQDRVATLQQARERTGGEFERVRASAVSAIKFMAGAREKFLVGTPGEKREIARALGVRYSFDRGQVSIEAHPALMPHLLLRPEGAGGVPPEGPESGRFELRKTGSWSTKKAAFTASFSSGGPMETFTERLWDFFSVKQDFIWATGVDTDCHPSDAP